MSDILGYLIVILVCVGTLVLVGIGMDKEAKKCEDNGGVWITHYMGGQCLTKEDIDKLRGDE